MQTADRAGNFRAEITEFGLYEADSGAVAVTLTVKLLEYWQDGQWIDWREYDMGASGNVWVIKKDNGGINQKATESLMRFAGWNGDVESIAQGTWQPTPCQVVLNEDTYQNQTSYKIAFINAYNSSPGMSGNVSPEKAKALAGKYGTQLKALMGNVKRNAPPTDKPAAPPAAKPQPKPAGVGAGVPVEDIPF